MTAPVIIELGSVNTSPRPVRMHVVNIPNSVTVPSYSPMRTNSPGRKVRVYVRINPAAACPTTLVAPSEIIKPINTDKPLKASVPAPGK